MAVEIHDREADPGENANVAGLPKNRGFVEKLGRQLRAGWGGLPKTVREPVTK